MPEFAAFAIGCAAPASIMRTMSQPVFTCVRAVVLAAAVNLLLK